MRKKREKKLFKKEKKRWSAERPFWQVETVRALGSLRRCSVGSQQRCARQGRGGGASGCGADGGARGLPARCAGGQKGRRDALDAQRRGGRAAGCGRLDAREEPPRNDRRSARPWQRRGRRRRGGPRRVDPHRNGRRRRRVRCRPLRGGSGQVERRERPRLGRDTASGALSGRQAGARAPSQSTTGPSRRTRTRARTRTREKQRAGRAASGEVWARAVVVGRAPRAVGR